MTKQPTIDQPLSGYRVLDLTRVLAGPYCTMMLGDQGADVLKLERPGAGDETRGWGPPFVGKESAYYLSCNRNKRSLTVDLKKAAGHALMLELAAKADVVVHNFRPAAAERLGLGYEALRAHNPQLVHVAISAFGQDGPYSERPGYDMVLAALSGMMHITGEPGGPPTKVGVALIDVLTGVHAAGAISSALLFRERTGVGQALDISLFDVGVASLANVASNYLVAGQEAQRWGTAHASIVPYQVFQASDRPLAIAVANQRQWNGLCRVLGRSDWTEDARFASNPARVEHRELLLAQIAERLATRSADEWLALLLEASVPAGAVNDMQHLFADPQLLHRDMLVEVEHASLGRLRLVGLPVKASLSPGSIRRPPPELGQHTDEVLSEVLGYSPARIAELRAGGVL